MGRPPSPESPCAAPEQRWPAYELAELTAEDRERYATIAGPVERPGGGAYSVRFRRERDAQPVAALLLASAVFIAELGFLIWLLFWGDHFPALSGPPQELLPELFMTSSVVLLAVFQMVNITTLCLSTSLARYPVPVTPPPNLRVAFLTTLVPGKEPLEIVEQTLREALRIRYDRGTLDVWLLDEGTDHRALADEIDGMCERLGPRFHRFSRRGVEAWNQPSGRFKARTKHGNYNAWLDAHGDGYDVFMSVDPDHVPSAEHFLERMLGYFRDPEVGFVVAPQVYRNCDNVVTKCAESQQFVFHTKVQPMGNRFGCPMLVGTNNAGRIAAITGVGGFRDSVTEDMATSLLLHSSGWKSVYTPDVLAYGLGPSSWTDYFTQQHRWSGGTFDALKGDFWRCFRRLPRGAKLHYSLILSYYPSVAIGWIVGALNCAVYLLVGHSGLKVSAESWHMIFALLILAQVALYDYNRRHNVSPFEKPNSSGMAGMLISVLTAPVYVTAFVRSLLGRTTGFAVTPKGASTSPDRLRTFRAHLLWGGFLCAALIMSAARDRMHANSLLWVGILLSICLLPATLWAAERHLLPRLHRATAATSSAEPSMMLSAVVAREDA